MNRYKEAMLRGVTMARRRREHTNRTSNWPLRLAWLCILGFVPTLVLGRELEVGFTRQGVQTSHLHRATGQVLYATGIVLPVIGTFLGAAGWLIARRKCRYVGVAAVAFLANLAALVLLGMIVFFFWLIF